MPRVSTIARYAFAVWLVVLASVLRPALAPGLQPLPYATFFVAVVLTGFVAGPGPTVLAFVLGYFCANWFFIEPVHVILRYPVAALPSPSSNDNFVFWGRGWRPLQIEAGAGFSRSQRRPRR